MDEVLYYKNGPSEWRYYSLGNVVKFEGGSQPPKKYFSNEKLEGMIRLIQIRDYKTNDFVTYVPKELCRRFCTKDDIMIGRYGPPIFQILRGIEGAYNVALIKASPNEEILDKLYLYYFMKNEHLFKLIDGLSQRTSGQTGIDMEILKKYIIPVPSKEEQRKISSIFSTVDKQIDNVDGLIKKNKELKKGLMQQLLIKGIGHTKFKNTEIGEIPEEWEVFRMGDLATFINGRAYKKDEFKLVGTPIIRIQNLTGEGQYVYSDLVLEEDKYIENGDLIYAWSATFGPFIWKGNKGIYHYHIWKIICDESKLNKNYYFYRLDYISQELDNKKNGSAFAHITKAFMENHRIAIPTIEEQKEIASVLSEADKKIEEYEKKKQKLEEIKKGLMQQLLTGKIRVI